MADFASPTKGPAMPKPSAEYGKTLCAGYVQIRKGSLLSSVMAGAWKRKYLIVKENAVLKYNEEAAAASSPDDGELVLTSKQVVDMNVVQDGKGSILKLLGGARDEFEVRVEDNVEAWKGAVEKLIRYSDKVKFESKPVGQAGGPITVLLSLSDHHTIVGCSAGASIMIVWDAATKTTVQTLEGHTAEVTDAIELTDKSTVASNSKDKTIRLWNVVSWECVRLLTGLDNDSPKIAEIPDFRMICVGSSTGHLKIWDIHASPVSAPWKPKSDDVTPAPVLFKEFQGLDFDNITTIMVMPNDTIITGHASGAVYVWDLNKAFPQETLAAGEAEYYIKIPHPDGEGSVTSMIKLGSNEIAVGYDHGDFVTYKLTDIPDDPDLVLPTLEQSPYYYDSETNEKVFIQKFLPSTLEEYGDALWQLPLTADEDDLMQSFITKTDERGTIAGRRRSSFEVMNVGMASLMGTQAVKDVHMRHTDWNSIAAPLCERINSARTDAGMTSDKDMVDASPLACRLRYQFTHSEIYMQAQEQLDEAEFDAKLGQWHDIAQNQMLAAKQWTRDREIRELKEILRGMRGSGVKGDQVQAHEGPIQAFVNLSGGLLATGGSDNCVKVFNAWHHDCIQEFHSVSKKAATNSDGNESIITGVTALAEALDGQLLSGGADGKVFKFHQGVFSNEEEED